MSCVYHDVFCTNKHGLYVLMCFVKVNKMYMYYVQINMMSSKIKKMHLHKHVLCVNVFCTNKHGLCAEVFCTNKYVLCVNVFCTNKHLLCVHVESTSKHHVFLSSET